MLLVTMPYSYYPDPTKGRPVFNGSIYVGKPDTDPENNQKQISVAQEDGTIVEVAQPIKTGSGGVPMYDGSPVQILVDSSSYSLKVLDHLGSQVYYSPNSDFEEIQGASVKDFGAVGDGTTDDTAAIQATIDYAGEQPSHPAVFIPAGVYRITAPLVIDKIGIHIEGAGRGRSLNSSITDSNGSTTILYDGNEGVTQDDDILNVTGVFHFGVNANVRASSIRSLSIWCQYLCNGIRGYNANTCSFTDIYILEPKIGVYFESGAFSNMFERVEIAEYDYTGFDLRANNHSNVLLKCTCSNSSSSVTTPNSALRLGQVDQVSAVNVIGCNFDSHHTEQIIKVQSDVYGLNFTGNYIEVYNDGATTHCFNMYEGDGINISGNRFTCENSAPVDYAIVCNGSGERSNGVAVTGNFFQNFTNAAVRVGLEAGPVFAAGNALDGMDGLPLISDANELIDTTVVGIHDGEYKGKILNAAQIGFGALTLYTVASGVVTIGATSYIRVDGEGSTADSVNSILGATQDGQLLVVQNHDVDEDITYVNNVGNLSLAGDCLLQNGRSKLFLIWNAANNAWEEISRSLNV